jgi:hypothetical protein
VVFALSMTPPQPQLGPPLWMADQCREAAEEMDRLGQRSVPAAEPVDWVAAGWGDAAGGCSWRDLV